MGSRQPGRVFGAVSIGIVLLFEGCTQHTPHPLGSAPAPSADSPSASPSAVVIPWINAEPPKEPATPSQRGIRRCRATDLAGTYLSSGAAAGNDINYIAIRDVSGSDCYVKGRPHVRLISTTGRSFPWSSGTTFFPDEGAIEILLEPRTSIPRVNSDIKSGQAKLGFTYFDCDPRDRIDRVVVEFSGQSFVTSVDPNAVSPTGLPACNGSTIQRGAVQTSANNFEPPPFPPSPYRDLLVTISPPDVIETGSRMRFLVSIANNGRETFRFSSPCPGYEESLGESGELATFSYRLNCKGIVIPFAETETFEMFLNVPKGATRHLNLAWQFLPQRDDTPPSSVRVLITSR